MNTRQPSAGGDARRDRGELASPRRVAEILGVSESSIKRWVDEGVIAAARTAGGHRRIRVTEVLRLVRAGRATLARPELLGIELAAPLDGRTEPPDAVGPLEELLREGRATEAESILLTLFLSGHDIAAIVDQTVAPALGEIGAASPDSAESIFIEHRASEICRRSLDRLHHLLPPPGPEAPVAVGGTVPNDFHQLPSVAAASVLAEAGWTAINLGFHTPVHSLSVAARRLRPRLVWLCASWVAEDADSLTAELEQLAGELDRAGARLLIGGCGASQLPLTLAGAPSQRSMTELVTFASSLYAGQA